MGVWQWIPGTPLDRAAFSAVASGSSNGARFISGKGSRAEPWTLRTLSPDRQADKRQAGDQRQLHGRAVLLQQPASHQFLLHPAIRQSRDDIRFDLRMHRYHQPIRPPHLDAAPLCLVNERVALRGPAVTEAFARKGVVYLKADWTNRSAEIASVLARIAPTRARRC